MACRTICKPASSSPAFLQSLIRRVELKAVTWGKDSHGLFDYEYSQYIMKRFQVADNVRIFRENDDVTAMPADDSVELLVPRAHTEFLLSIAKNSSNLLLISEILH